MAPLLHISVQFVSFRFVSFCFVSYRSLFVPPLLGLLYRTYIYEFVSSHSCSPGIVFGIYRGSVGFGFGFGFGFGLKFASPK